MLELYTPIRGDHKTEASFTTAWLKEIKKKGYWTHKISDASIGHKPFDCMIESTRQNFKVEIKRIEKNVFRIDQLRENQFSSFLRISRLEKERRTPENSCLIVIFSTTEQDYIIIPFIDVVGFGYGAILQIDFKNKTFVCQSEK